MRRAGSADRCGFVDGIRADDRRTDADVLFPVWAVVNWPQADGWEGWTIVMRLPGLRRMGEWPCRVSTWPER